MPQADADGLSPESQAVPQADADGLSPEPQAVPQNEAVADFSPDHCAKFLSAISLPPFVYQSFTLYFYYNY